MKKTLVTLLLTAAMVLPACSNWNKMTPKGMDNKAIEEEIRKNMAADHITGLTVDVNGGTVTLKGHLSAGDKARALDDARKVTGVTSVNDQISVD
jgi:osmotically-inducible protein OsmY